MNNSGGLYWDPVEVIGSPAWRSLTKNATDIANICWWKYQQSPEFNFTLREAVESFVMTRPTFCKSMKHLEEVGLIKRSYRNGAMSTYTLSDGWKTWTPVEKGANRAPGYVFFTCVPGGSAKPADVVKSKIRTHFKAAI